MPQHDHIRVTLSYQQDGVTMSNAFYFQWMSINNQPEAPGELLDWTVEELVPRLAQTMSSDVTFICAVARWIEPAPTWAVTRTMSIPGDISSDALPTTCYIIAKYWMWPFNSLQRNHWKLGGIPESHHEGGLLTENGWAQYQNFFELVNAEGFDTPNHQFQWVRPGSPPNPGEPSPFIDRLRIGRMIENFKGRQERACSG